MLNQRSAMAAAQKQQQQQQQPPPTPDQSAAAQQYAVAQPSTPAPRLCTLFRTARRLITIAGPLLIGILIPVTGGLGLACRAGAGVAGVGVGAGAGFTEGSIAALTPDSIAVLTVDFMAAPALVADFMEVAAGSISNRVKIEEESMAQCHVGSLN